MLMRTAGDQARAYTLQSAGIKLKNSLNTLSQEISTGRVADVGQRLGGNTRALSGIESRIRMLSEFGNTSAEALTAAGTMQHTLGMLQEASDRMAASLLANSGSGLDSVMTSQSIEAGSTFEEAVSRLNVSVAGVHLFGGVHTDTAPLISGKQILNELAVQAAGKPTATEVRQVIEDWFDAPAGGGGFIDFAYQGSMDRSRDIRVSAHEVIALDIDATSPAIRDTLKALAMAALPAEGILSNLQAEKRALLDASFTDLMVAGESVLNERGRLGSLENRTNRAQVENSAEIASLEIARNTMVSADPFETATALTQVQTQMELLYTITARLSNLSLVDYLR